MKFQFVEDKTPLYMKVYNYYSEMITEGKLTSGQKLPSIRRCSEELGVSRTTVENAYLSLAADGLIISKKSSGFYINDLQIKKQTVYDNLKTDYDETKIIYNFSSASADSESFNFDQWRRYIKSALRQDERLLSYGEPQGEYELRTTLAKYISQKRNVVCTAGNIIIGAGIQSLLHIFCAVVGRNGTVRFYNQQFKQGIAIFRDHGWNISDDNASVIYVNPSHTNESGDVMNSDERFKMIKNAFDTGSLIIEDDYDNEFSYFNKRTPSLQSLASGKNVIYVGTFSRLLLPSIRMSYMVLPEELMEKYRYIKNEYNQTASKTEQIALCQFIRDGHLDSQIRKLRRLYSVKSRCLTDVLNKIFEKNISIYDNDSDIYVKAEIKNAPEPEEFMKKARENGVALIATKNQKGRTDIILSCTSVKSEDFEKAVILIKNAIK